MRWILGAALAMVMLGGGCENDPLRADDAPLGTSPTTPGLTAGTARTTIPIPTTTLPDLGASSGLAATIRQFREDEAVEVIQIEVVREPAPDSVTAGTSDADDHGGLIDVVSVQLEWPGFSTVPATPRPVAVAAGQRVDLPTPLGSMVCPPSGTPSYREGVVIMVIRRSGGSDVAVRAPLLEDAQTALDNVHGKGCVRQRLAEQVGLSYATPWTRSDPDGIPTATTDLIVSRLRTDEPIAVTGVDGSVLLFVNPVGAFPVGGAVLDSGEPSLTVPIVVTGSGRCDGHALSDSKKTYEFQVQVSIGGADPVGTNLSVSTADRPLLNQVIVDTCGSDHHR